MINEIEEKFVKQYITKGRQERLVYELGSSKKRINAMSRFCHSSLELIKPNMIYEWGDIDCDRLLLLLKKYGKNEKNYIMAYDENIDKKYMNNEEAIKRVIGNGMAAVIINNGIVIIETEQEVGPAIKYVLINR